MPNLGTKKQAGGREGQDGPVLHKNHSPTFPSFFFLTFTFKTAVAEGIFHYLLHDKTCLLPEYSCFFFSEVVFMLRYATKGGHTAGVHCPPFCLTTAGLCNRRWQNWEGEGLHTIHLAKCRYIWYEHLPEALLSCCREQEAHLGHNSCHPKAGIWNRSDEPSL